MRIESNSNWDQRPPAAEPRLVESGSARLAPDTSKVPADSRPGLPRVLMVVESSGGGTGRHVLDLCQALTQRGCDVHLLYSALRADRLFLDRVQKIAPSRRQIVPMRTVPNPADLLAIWAVRRYLRRHGPFDIIHGHSSKGGAVARLAAIGTGTAAIYTPHGLTLMNPDLAAWKHLLYRSIEVGLSLATSLIITVSPEEHRAATSMGLGRTRSVTVPNGVEESEAAPRDQARNGIGAGDEHIVFGFVGRLVDQKAPKVLLKGFAAAAAVEPRARLAIVGSGPLEPALKKLARVFGVRDKVTWLGERDARQVMSGFDVLAITSRNEGLPYVVLEAMAAALPIIATASAGVEILVEPGKNGIVVGREDTPGFAAAMVCLATEPAMRARFGAESRRRAARFTIDAMTQRTLGAYRSALAARVCGGFGMEQAAPLLRAREAGFMRAELVRGASAEQFLSDGSFKSEWSALCQSCPWATAFQAPRFVCLWFSIYSDEYEPVLVVLKSRRAGLVGLLTLARSRADGTLAPAGRIHAEYHAWICDPVIGQQFPPLALAAVRREFPWSRLTFKYLPAGTPTEWLNDPETNHRCVLRTHRRPVWSFGDGKALAASMKKANNKNRLRHLKKLGPIEFKRITDSEEFAALFDEMVQLYDLRHGAVHGSESFCGIDRQKQFHLAMMRQQGLLHATALRVGGRLAAAHFGVCGHEEVHFGTIVHDPRLARNSPGKIQYLMLAQMMFAEGFKQADLTPGGDAYKERHATGWDEVFTLEVLPTELSCFCFAALTRLKPVLKGLLKIAGLTQAEAQYRLRSLRRPARLAVCAWRSVRDWFGQESETRVYFREAGQPNDMAAESEAEPQQVSRDSWNDLLAYRPRPTQPSRQDVLSSALARLEAGEHAYTIMDQGRLVWLGWMAEQPSEELLAEALPGAEFPSDCLLVRDLYALEGGIPSFPAGALPAMLRDARQRASVRRAVVLVPAGDSAARRQLEELGFTQVGAVLRKTGFGRTRMTAQCPGLPFEFDRPAAQGGGTPPARRAVAPRAAALTGSEHD